MMRTLVINYSDFIINYSDLKKTPNPKPSSCAALAAGYDSVTASPGKFQHDTLHLTASEEMQHRNACFSGL